MLSVSFLRYDSYINKATRRRVMKKNVSPKISLKKLMTLIALVLLTTACKKECKEGQELVNGKCENKEVVPPNTEPTKKHNATVVYNRGEGPQPADLINAVAIYKGSTFVDTVFFEVLGDWSNMSENGANNQMKNVFDPVFELPMKGQVVHGKGTFNTSNFSEAAKKFLIAKGYSFSL